MEKIRSEVLIQILKQNRESFNKDFTIARHLNIRLKPEVFLKYFVEIAEPIVENNKEKTFESLNNLTKALYSKLLELCSQELIGAEGKYPGLEFFFVKAIQHFKNLLFSNPEDFISNLINAYFNLFSSNPLIAQKWGASVLSLSNNIEDSRLFKNLGLILAWLSGMPAYRTAALESLINLSINEILLLPELPKKPIQEDSKKSWLERLKENPWINIQDALNAQNPSYICFRTAGAFRGFDGNFITPPLLFQTNNGFVASDGEGTWKIFADYYGTQLIRSKEEFSDSSSSFNAFKIINSQSFEYLSQSYRIPNAPGIPITSSVSDLKTLCYTSSLSHKIFIAGIGSAPL